MTIQEYIKNWIAIADEDLLAAEREMQFSEPITRVVFFHCQQSVEKYFKAYLLLNKTQIKKTHNLETLLEICINLNSKFKYVDVGNLSSYAVQVRCPDDFYIPSVEEAKESILITKKIKEFILPLIKKCYENN